MTTSRSRLAPRLVRSTAAALFTFWLAACSSSATGQQITDSGAPVTSSPPSTIALDSGIPSTSSSPPTTSGATSSTSVDVAKAACITGLPLAVKVAQLVWPAVYGQELVQRTPTLATWGVGGAVLMTWPIGANSTDLVGMKTAGAIPLLIATDEEGGPVQRLGLLGEFPSAAQVAATMTPAQAQAMISAHAVPVHQVGIDIVFAPVVDVAPLVGTGPIGVRSFGSDPTTVTQFADAYVRGWQSAGILPVLKHFPGHGSASADTHQLGATTPPLDQLQQRDLLPYAALSPANQSTAIPAGVVGVMVGHLTVPGLTDVGGLPASLSPAAYQLLRDQYGYADALVFTDALGMKAISTTFTDAESAVLAIAAGADVVIFTDTDATPAVIQALISAAENQTVPMSRIDDAVGRVLTAKRFDPCTAAFN